jgi:hypothetical protein
VIEISTAMSADDAKKLLAKDLTHELATSEMGPRKRNQRDLKESFLFNLEI